MIQNLVTGTSSQLEKSSAQQNQTLAAVAGLWPRFKDTILGRVSVVEKALSALVEGELGDELRRKAEQEAHKLAGSVGSFGFKEASRLACQIERPFRSGLVLEMEHLLFLSKCAADLRRELESIPLGEAARPAETVRDGRPILLVVDSDKQLAQQLVEEAGNRQVRAEVALGVAAAREFIGRTRPDVVLLDLSFPNDAQSGLKLLEELTAGTPPVPVVVLTALSSLVDRVEVARRGAKCFLQKPLPSSEALDAVMQLLNPSNVSESKVMVVDDDPQVLATLKALLEPKRIRVITLNDALQFWEVFERTSPSLLVLDVEMPHLDGIELCKVVRNDPRWRDIPIIFLTHHADTEVVQGAFAAGADDFVHKPIVGTELFTRINNRLEHARSCRNFAETDPLTGLSNRRKSTAMLNQLINLTSRHRQPLSFVILDLDNFKHINDCYGHDMGDQVLRKLGTVMLNTFRGEDVVARWGGEEFAIGMFGMRRQDAAQRMWELLESFRRDVFTTSAGVEFHVTFNTGIAQFPEDGGDLQALYEAADAALYQAKKEGRNRISLTERFAKVG